MIFIAVIPKFPKFKSTEGPHLCNGRGAYQIAAALNVIIGAGKTGAIVEYRTANGDSSSAVKISGANGIRPVIYEKN